MSFNVKIFPSKFIRTKFDYETYSFNNEKYVDALYLWDDGKIKRIYVSENKIKRIAVPLVFPVRTRGLFYFDPQDYT